MTPVSVCLRAAFPQLLKRQQHVVWGACCNSLEGVLNFDSCLSDVIPKSNVRIDLYRYHRTTWCNAKDTDFDLFQDLHLPS